MRRDGPLDAGVGCRIAPLGVPTLILSDDAGLLETARVAYDDWRAQPPFAEPVITLRLEVGGDSGALEEARIGVEGSRLALGGAGVAGWADAISRRAHGVAPRRLIGAPEALAEAVTDTLLLFLLARTDRTPLHAAGVMLGDTALVLAGPSGSGKSTLSLAAMTRELPILSDDTLYIQLQPGVRIWGFRRPIHVFPADAPRFNHATRRRGGKLKTVIPLSPGAAGPLVADKATLILLERGDRLALTPIDAKTALAGLSRLDAGFDLLPQESGAAARALAGDGAWRLTLARDPGAAIDFLRERLS